MSRETSVIAQECGDLSPLILGKKIAEGKRNRQGNQKNFFPPPPPPLAQGLYPPLTTALFSVSNVLLEDFLVHFSFILFKAICSYHFSHASLQSFIIGKPKVNFQDEGKGRCYSVLILDHLT